MDQAEKTQGASKQPLSERIEQILGEVSQHKSTNPNKLIRASRKLIVEPVTVEVTAQKVDPVPLRDCTLAEMAAGKAKLAHHQEQHLAARMAQAANDLNQQVETNNEFIPNMSQRSNPA